MLRTQHKAGRDITEQIITIGKNKSLSADDGQKMVKLLTDFNVMYRPHEAREDTILFPAMKKIVSKHEYDSLREDFEKKETELFGNDGFETMVNKVAELEKKIGLYDLSQFTPTK